MHRHRHWQDILLLILAFLLTAGLVALYVSRERFFYYFDYAGFEGVAGDLASLFPNELQKLLYLVKTSLSLDYNYFYAVPILPFILVFGEQRLSYELGVTLLYQLPYFLALGAIASRLFTGSRRFSFWVAFFITLLIPVAWAPLLRGYPDVGAAFLLTLACWLYLLDRSLKRWWQVLAIGVLVALAVVFRRHFAYPAVAFYVAIFVHLLIMTFTPLNPDRALSRRIRWNVFMQVNIRLGATVLGTLLTLALVDRPLIESVLSVDYNNLYASYQVSLSSLLQFFSGQYGLLLLLLVVLGYFLAFQRHLLDVSAAIFVFLFAFVAFFTWVLVARQEGVHYTLHFTFFVVLGLTALFLAIWRIESSRTRIFSLITFSSLLLVNLIISLFMPLPVSKETHHIVDRFTSAYYLPLKTPDYDLVKELIAYLREKSQPGSKIYVADSSPNMNYDLLRSAEKALYGRDNLILDILFVPMVDSRDSYPLELLMRSDFVVVSTPPQLHLSPKEQKIVASVHDAFYQDWEIAKDFKRLPRQFIFSDGSRLNVFQRIRPTNLQTAVRTFHTMREQIGIRPGSQPNWIYLGTQQTGVVKNSLGNDHVWVSPGNDQVPEEGAFLWAEPVIEDGRVKGLLKFDEAACDEISLKIQTLDERGKIIETQSIQIESSESRFDLPYQGVEATYLVFYLAMTSQNDPTKTCVAEVRWMPSNP